MEVNIWIFLLLNVLKVIVVTVILLMCVAYTVLLERKVVGRIQNRWGPSRVGPFGLLQPLVDGLKLFLKEDLMPHRRLSAAVHPCANYRAQLRAHVHFDGSLRAPTSATTASISSRFPTSTSAC